MRRKMILKAHLVWLLIVVLAVLNGLIREYLLGPNIGVKWALPASGVILSVMVLVVCYKFHSWMGCQTPGECLFVGLLWVFLTLAFEFLLGHYLLQKPWAEIIQVFNLKAGNLFALVLGVCWIGPWLVLKLNIHNH